MEVIKQEIFRYLDGVLHITVGFYLQGQLQFCDLMAENFSSLLLV
jgi:hypothetical protein